MKYCELLYPFLIECCKYTEDRFWKSIFEDLAYGITPSGTYINKDFLMCNYKDKEFTYKIQNKNSREIYDDLFNIFKSKLCLVSRDEIINKKKIIEDKYSNHLYEYVYWSDIKKKNIKELMIERYAIEMKNNYNLTHAQTKYLVSIIFLAFVFKIFTSNDIEIENGKILNIKGLEYESGKIILKKNIYDIKVNICPQIIVDKKMSDEWEKYLSALRKN